jgi:hypothetical protein
MLGKDVTAGLSTSHEQTGDHKSPVALDPEHAVASMDSKPLAGLHPSRGAAQISVANSDG